MYRVWLRLHVFYFLLTEDLHRVQSMEDGNEDNRCKSPMLSTDGDVSTGKIKERCRVQREALPGEPKCVICGCGRYGEYICDETDDDISSLECKQALLCRVANSQLLAGLPPPKKLPATDECFYVIDSDNKSGSLSLTMDQTKLLRSKLEIPVKGELVVAPILSFSSCNLAQKLLQNTEAAGYDVSTPVQMQEIPAALIGKSLLVSADRGSGKTASFLVPVVSRCANIRLRGPQTRKRH